MNTETISASLPWTNKQDWVKPAEDYTLVRSFKHGARDVENAIKTYSHYSEKFRTCVQAGGALGIWASRLAQFFDVVVTFEPEPTNWQCLTENTKHIENITPINKALGRSSGGLVHMELAPDKANRCGAWHVCEGGEIETASIDDIGLDAVDLIYIDIEGSEYDALLGAEKTISRDRPIIGLENMGWHERYNGGAEPTDLLRECFGYALIGKPYQFDLMYGPIEKYENADWRKHDYSW